MDVSQANFEEFLEDFFTHFPKTEYYSIDFELTGIKTKEAELVSDLPFEKYIKLRSAANKYRIIQLGLCLFIRKGDKTFEARPYNIYLFPRELGYMSPQISIDVSAAEFNTRMGMNWNKWFSEGITYLSLKQIKKRKQEADKKENIYADSSNSIKLTKEDDIKKSKEFHEKLNAWIETKDKSPLVIAEENSFFRKHIYDTLRQNYPDLVFENPTEKDKSKEIHIYNLLEESDKDEYYKKKAKESEMIYNRQVGFSQVFQALLDSKKPLIGHNFYFDLMFLYSHFIEQLPFKQSEFKQKMNEYFPTIYDTKFMFHQTKFEKKLLYGASNLEILSQVCLKKDDPDFFNFELILDEKFKAYDLNGNQENSRYHEAGYDAFLTGMLFTKVFFALNSEEQKFLKNSVNALKSLYYLKLDQEEDLMYKKGITYLIQQGAKDPKIDTKTILSKFDDLKLTELIRFIPIQQASFQGAMLVLEHQKDTQIELFEHRIQELTKDGMTILTHKEYIQLRKEKYDAQEKTDKDKDLFY